MCVAEAKRRKKKTQKYATRTLRDYASTNSQLAQLPDSGMGFVRPCLVQRRPAQETPGPVPFPCLVVRRELVVVYRSVGLVQRVRAIGAPVVCQARCHGYSRTGENGGFVLRGCAQVPERRGYGSGRGGGRCWWGREEEAGESFDGAVQGVG